MEPTYGKRLHKAARDEFKAFWTAYRNWVTFVSLLLSPPIFQIVRHGWRSMVNFDEAVTNGVLGLIVSLGGTYLIAMRKGAANLDSALRKTIGDQHRAIQQHEQKLGEIAEKPVRSPAEEHYFKAAQKALQKLEPDAITVLRHLALHGTLTYGLLPTTPPNADMTSSAMRDILNRCVDEQLVTVRPGHLLGTTECLYQIAPGMKAVLDELLYQ